MGRFSDSPHFLLEAFFDGLNETEPIEKPINEFQWEVVFVSSFDNGDGTRTYTDDPYDFDTVAGEDNIVFTDYRLTSWNRREYYDGNLLQSFNSYIVAPFINIGGRGGGIMDLFVKEEDEGYQPITVRYKDREGDTFNFINSGVMEYEPGENITDIIHNEEMYTDSSYKGDKYYFTFWDKIAVDTFNLFENDRETYFRKDSLYHDFLKIYAKDMMVEELGVELDIRNYVNTDKLFSYFHNIYKSQDGTEARIIFDGMKNYVMRAIPEHQRTPRFTELCNIFFDQLYQEVFDLLKNVWSLIDPMEVDDRYLGYLSRYYDMFDVDVEGATILHVREFIRDMIWMIKRKGTYTEFYVLWRILTGTKNILSVYERWHRKDVEQFPDWPSTISPPCTGTWPNYPHYSNTNSTTVVPPSAWRDTLYVNRPEYDAPDYDLGAGPGWYDKWYPNVYDTNYIPPSGVHCPAGSSYPTPLAPSGDNLMLSTHYILETDISSEPLAKEEILTKGLWDQMHEYWEYIRPVNRVSNYRIVEAPITDISGKYIHLYQVTSKSSAFLKTVSGITLGLEEGAYIHNNSDTEQIKWSVLHNLGTDILIQCFDNDLNEIVPKDIEYTLSTTYITWAQPEAGFAIIRKSDWGYTRPLPVMSNVWKFYHSRLQKEVVVHFRNDSERFYAGNTELADPPDGVSDNVTATFSDTEQNSAMLGTGNFIFLQTTPAITWEVPHNLAIKGVIMVCYDNDNNRIHPDGYELVTSDRCDITFPEEQSGYVVLVSVGDLSIEDLLEELEDLIEQVTWIAYVHDDYGNKIEVDRGSILKTYKDDNFYYFDLQIDKEATYIINEIELYDKNGWDEHGNNILFHSLMSNLYKPPGVDLTFHYRLEIPTAE
jgi:hypothetical protein